jgi:DNA-binding transcriptional LysR family regulator
LVKVQILSRLSATELYRRLPENELDAANVHASPHEAHDVHLIPLYRERYVLLAPADMLGSGAATMTWARAAQLPLAVRTPDMRDRQIIDKAFADHGITVSPQVETDSVASLIAAASAGNWASIVPHTWLWTSLLGP